MGRTLLLYDMDYQKLTNMLEEEVDMLLLELIVAHEGVVQHTIDMFDKQSKVFIKQIEESDRQEDTEIALSLIRP